MIDGIGPGEKGRVALERVSVERSQKVAKVAENAAEVRVTAPPSLAYEMMTAVGTPVDMAKVAQLRTAIANGQYPVNPAKIAERMLALDIPLQPNAA